MNQRLQEMLDHYEITKTLSEYCHGCDRCDEHRMGSIYLQDSWDDHGSVKAPGPEFARLMTAEILARTDTLYHMLGQSLINVSGDEAGAETYFLAAGRSTRDDGVQMCNQLGGRFVDKLQREDGRWRVKHRVVVRDWSISMPIEHDWVAKSGLREGERSNADPSFAALGLVHSGVHANKKTKAGHADKTA
jgi:hypothetical protein